MSEAATANLSDAFARSVAMASSASGMGSVNRRSSSPRVILIVRVFPAQGQMDQTLQQRSLQFCITLEPNSEPRFKQQEPQRAHFTPTPQSSSKDNDGTSAFAERLVSMDAASLRPAQSEFAPGTRMPQLDALLGLPAHLATQDGRPPCDNIFCAGWVPAWI